MTLTAKRQATLPAALCEELGVAPGDKIILERREEGGETLWVLHGRKRIDWSWIGAGHRYAEGKSHRWEDIERTIAEAWGHGSSTKRRGGTRKS